MKWAESKRWSGQYCWLQPLRKDETPEDELGRHPGGGSATTKKMRSRFINRKLFLTRILHFFHQIWNLRWKSFRSLHICLYKIFPFWYRKFSLKLENLAVGKSKFDLMKISFQAKQIWSRLQLIIYR